MYIVHLAHFEIAHTSDQDEKETTYILQIKLLISFDLIFKIENCDGTKAVFTCIFCVCQT